jgi:hypothetical protein
VGHPAREKKIEFQERIYNLHVLGSFLPSLGCLSAPSLLGGMEPTRLSNQPAGKNVSSFFSTVSKACHSE